MMSEKSWIWSGFACVVENAHAIAKEHGWWDAVEEVLGGPQDARFRDLVGTKLMLIVTEVAEAMEEVRVVEDLRMTTFRKDGKPLGFPSELADIHIRTADLAGALGIDLAAIVKLKMEFNETREYMHGKKL